MLLHNQTKNPLRWDGGGRVLVWEPYGATEVPDELVRFLRKQKVPVGETPVSPESKARAVARDAEESARNDELNLLRERVAAAEADVKAARTEVETAELARGEAEKLAKKQAGVIRELESELSRAKGDKEAAESLLAETAKKLELAERAASQGRAREKSSKSG